MDIKLFENTGSSGFLDGFRYEIFRVLFSQTDIEGFAMIVDDENEIVIWSEEHYENSIIKITLNTNYKIDTVKKLSERFVNYCKCHNPNHYRLIEA